MSSPFGDPFAPTPQKNINEAPSVRRPIPGRQPTTKNNEHQPNETTKRENPHDNQKFSPVRRDEL